MSALYLAPLYRYITQPLRNVYVLRCQNQVKLIIITEKYILKDFNRSEGLSATFLTTPMNIKLKDYASSLAFSGNIFDADRSI